MMEFKKTKYCIDDLIDGHRVVVGFAVNQDIVPVRIAVRKKGLDWWQCDHWDTGASIATSNSKLGAALAGLGLVHEKQHAGEYDKAIAKVMSVSWTKRGFPAWPERVSPTLPPCPPPTDGNTP